MVEVVEGEVVGVTIVVMGIVGGPWVEVLFKSTEVRRRLVVKLGAGEALARSAKAAVVMAVAQGWL
jgi:hypothetical protein